jgi:tyrosyl-tRNA synthetase
MNSDIYEILTKRGILAQATHPDKIREILHDRPVTFYIGFDPTADSLHIGHFVQIMVMSHMQRAGHKPIAIMGGGTARIGDPSGKCDMRKMLNNEDIDRNVEAITKQFAGLIDISDSGALIINNAQWLDHLNYVEFLRDIGIHFSVNKMLSADCFRTRYEKGLNFLEFNYMLMQAYDFYRLYKDHGCILQLGGDDQWSNIIAGIELIRRKEGEEAYGLTFNLLTTSEGIKMGKTEKGALWLDPAKTTPYEFYQYLRNIQDADVINSLRMLTFISLEEIEEMSGCRGEDMNKIKERLAFEVTKMVHGETEAVKVQNAAREMFGKGLLSDDMPIYDIQTDKLPVNIIDICLLSGLVPSKAEARRLITQKGIFFNDKRIDGFDFEVTKEAFAGKKALLLQKGKKTFIGIRLLP